MVKIDGDNSKEFNAGKGLRQGDALACLLFNLALEKAVRDAGLQERQGNIFTRLVQLLAYADDLDIVGRSLQAVADAFDALWQALLAGLDLRLMSPKQNTW